MTPARALRQAAAALEALRLSVETLTRENAALRATLRERDKSRRPGRVNRTCQACGRDFAVRLGDLRAGHVAGRFCSRECAGGGRPVLPKLCLGSLVTIADDARGPAPVLLWTVEAIAGGMIHLSRVLPNGFWARRVEPREALRVPGL